MLAIGHLELRLYRLRCDCARLARRIDMLRAALNRGDTPDTEAIDAALDAEFAEFEKTVSQMIGELNDALARRDMEELTPEEVREIREVYYRIVKRLHPDVNPGSGPEMLPAPGGGEGQAQGPPGKAVGAHKGGGGVAPVRQGPVAPEPGAP